jgi:hypothetical protein
MHTLSSHALQLCDAITFSLLPKHKTAHGCNQKMRLHQQNIPAWLNATPPCCCQLFAAAAHAANVSMYVYDNNDIVSNELRGTQHAWESSEINQMLWALQQQRQVQQLLTSQGKPQGPAISLMVDIGANIGWWVLQQGVG